MYCTPKVLCLTFGVQYNFETASCSYKLAVTFTMQVTVGNYPFRTIY